MSAPAPQKPPPKPRTRGPVLLAIGAAMSLLFLALSSWMLGLAIQIGGGFVFWKDKAVEHSLAMVQEDLGYIAAAPSSLLVGNTVAFSNKLMALVRRPFEKIGALAFYETIQKTPPAQPDLTPSNLTKGAEQTTRWVISGLASFAMVAMLVAQDVLLRLSVALFALPAFALACLMGTLDGFMRRDQRRWSGGRESSFLYHHAKRQTLWALTGGFGLYLSWPLGGFNPSYMVLIFTVLVAAGLSIWVGSFKKYL